MKYLHILGIGLVLGLGASTLLAAERATFILTNGERVSGTVVFHTDERTNFRVDKQLFSLGQNDGTEVHIPFTDVVVIDFTGGQPRADELSALPAGGQFMTLRNGNTRRGRLVDMIGGDTVRWEETSGGRVDLPILEVRRIYLNVARARDMYDVPAPPSSSEVVGPRRGGRQAAETVPEGMGVAVRGNVPWTDAGMAVRAGENLRFAPTGRVIFSDGNGAVAGPDGNDSTRNRAFPVPALPVGALIGRIGVNGLPFAIGSGPSAIRMGTTGRLFLGINDDFFVDNSGGFRVIVTRVR